MKCPVCTNVHLVMSDRQGVEIDYCPTCRGVWLDRGELDKIIEKSASSSNSYTSNSHAQPKYENTQKEHFNKYNNHENNGYHKKKKESFFSELFDF